MYGALLFEQRAYDAEDRTSEQNRSYVIDVGLGLRIEAMRLDEHFGGNANLVEGHHSARRKSGIDVEEVPQPFSSSRTNSTSSKITTPKTTTKTQKEPKTTPATTKSVFP